MNKTLLMSEADIENAVLNPEATDESLIDAARELNASYKGHLKRSIEDFWRLGETLSHLFQRRHLQGRWADVLERVGINVTTDNQARRMYQATTLDGLSEFKNQTQALRSFGILSTPTPSGKVRDVSSPEVSHGKSELHTESCDRGQISTNPEEETGRVIAARVERPESRINPSKKRRAVEPAQVPAEMDDDQTPPIARQANVQGTDDSLEVLAKIAARLEYLAADVIDVTPDHLAQIDRLLVAIDLIRSKGGAHVAA